MGLGTGFLVPTFLHHVCQYLLINIFVMYMKLFIICYQMNLIII